MADTKISAATPVSGAGVISTPVHLAGSTVALRLAHNLEATTNPGAGDDVNDGYSVGSFWFNTTTGVMWRALSVSAAAAVWQRVGALPLIAFGLTDVYAAQPGVSSYTGAALVADTLYFSPISLPVRRTITKIAIQLNSAVVGNARLGLYDIADDNTPGTLIVDGGTVSTNGTTKAEVTISQDLPPGNYFGAVVFDAAANVQRVSGTVQNLGWRNSGSLVSVNGMSRSFTYAALPADESAQAHANSGTAPWIGIR